METVSAVRTPDYRRETMDQAVERHFSLLDLSRLLKPGMKVTLKPNLLMRRTPEEATTTHPALVGAIARALKKRGITQITLADSPGGPYTRPQLSGIYQTCGMTEMAKEEGITLNLETGHGEREFPQGTMCHSFSLIDPVLEADLVINICKLKTHCMTTLSGGVKNLFGCIPGLMKPELHCRFPHREDFCRMLVDLCQTVSPAITFCDAVISMEGDGPSGGTPISTGYTFCSASPYALDEALCRFGGFPPQQVETVKIARQAGLCDPARVQLIGDVPSPVQLKMPRSKSVDFTGHVPALLRKPAKYLLEQASPRPVITKKDCIGCGKCAQSCPAHTISIRENKAAIDYSHCIRCFCCHEMCPAKAIRIKRLSLLQW